MLGLLDSQGHNLASSSHVFTTLPSVKGDCNWFLSFFLLAAFNLFVKRKKKRYRNLNALQGVKLNASIFFPPQLPLFYRWFTLPTRCWSCQIPFLSTAAAFNFVFKLFVRPPWHYLPTKRPRCSCSDVSFSTLTNKTIWQQGYVLVPFICVCHKTTEDRILRIFCFPMSCTHLSKYPANWLITTVRLEQRL